MTEQRQAATRSMRRGVPPAAPVIFVMVDRHLRLIDVNRALAALDDTGSAEPPRRPVRDVLPSGLAEEVIGQVRHVLATGRPVTGAEFELLPAGTGQPRSWRASYFAVRAGERNPADAGAGDPVVGVGAVIEDITERHAAERRDARQQQFLLTISAAVLHGEKSVGEIARQLVDHLILNVGDGCAIWLYTGDGAHLRAAAVGHRNPRKAEWLRAELADPLPVTDDDLLAEAIRRRRMIVIDDVASGPDSTRGPSRVQRSRRTHRTAGAMRGAAGRRQCGVGRRGRGTRPARRRLRHPGPGAAGAGRGLGDAGDV